MPMEKMEIDYKAAYIELRDKNLGLEAVANYWYAYTSSIRSRIKTQVDLAIKAGFDATFTMNEPCPKFEQIIVDGKLTVENFGSEKTPLDFGLIDLGRHTNWRWDIFTLIDQECKMALRFVKQSKIIDGADITATKTVTPENTDMVRVRTMTGWTAMNVDEFVYYLMMELLE